VRVENDYRAASHSQNILEQAGIIAGLLNDSENAVLTQLAQVERALTAWQRMDDSIAEAEELNRQAIAQLQDLLGTVQSRAERVDLDPAQLRQLEDRLNLVQSLKRKYGGTLESVRAFGEKAAAQLAALEGRAEFLATLAQREKAARSALEKAAAELSKRGEKSPDRSAKRFRRNCARSVSPRRRFRLKSLRRQNRALRAATCRIYFRAKPGEAARPLRAIASSGEMARVMLAVKTTLAEVDEIPILIFDEVDANVGGETAGQVGKKLRGLGRCHQVLCITHLPQVAAQGRVIRGGEAREAKPDPDRIDAAGRRGAAARAGPDARRADRSGAGAGRSLLEEAAKEDSLPARFARPGTSSPGHPKKTSRSELREIRPRD